jgi:hypothetical protein
MGCAGEIGDGSGVVGPERRGRGVAASFRWAYSYLSPFRTTAGIAAACAGDWSAAEQHHLTAIHQTDTVPYRVSQPTAREWYATMLLDRNGPGAAAKARLLLSEALAMYESMEMAFHANRTSGKLATL